jgi:hypothetical protein
LEVEQVKSNLLEVHSAYTTVSNTVISSSQVSHDNNSKALFDPWPLLMKEVSRTTSRAMTFKPVPSNFGTEIDSKQGQSQRTTLRGQERLTGNDQPKVVFIEPLTESNI